MEMGDVLVEYLRSSLPEELAFVLNDSLNTLENGDYEAIFQHPQVQILLGHQDDERTKEVFHKDFSLWSDYIFHRLGLLLSKRDDEQGIPAEETSAYRQHLMFIAAVASTYAFLQSTVTGPPLPFSSASILLPKTFSSDLSSLSSLREGLVSSLSSDGVAAYKLTPNVELLSLADTILVCPPIQKNVKAANWAKMRVDVLHQRLLSEISPSLQSSIYRDLEFLNHSFSSPEAKQISKDFYTSFLLERAAIHTHHGLDKEARKDLEEATSERHFEFALTGLLGKRTKFQQKDTSQLVVLARSQASEANGLTQETREETTAETTKPKNLDLNDDTLLEAISFTEGPSIMDFKEESNLPASLTSLDPANQPMLDPLDSIILLSLAASITNTSPSDGLTREETVPYATRVLEGGSSNWQVYTQALLVRSRIEGYRSRTIERGLLQLQALVDQIVAETTSEDSKSSIDTSASRTFLPKPKDGEIATVQERLRYIFPLASPSRWELEAELASRWVSLGGLRSALEIYERLEMWAEAALCWAATEREDKAKKLIRRQLFQATGGDDLTINIEEEKWEGAARDPPPSDAARLYCILGDIDQDISRYEKAWEVSNHRYARAQRSLGRHYFSQKDYAKAVEAYSLSLKINALNQTTWFALGCAYLELARFTNAVGAFSRCVQLDDQDAEAWSNLAASLLHLHPVHSPDRDRPISDPRNDALKAFKRAAVLKHDNYRIWSNVLTVAASTAPPAYTDIVTAQRRLCELRGPTEGEKCIDETILDALVRSVITADAENTGYDPSKPGVARLVVELVDKHITPLITLSPRLWQTVAKLALFRRKPSTALEAHEKAWRAVTSQPGWVSGTEKQWNDVVDATVDLADAYESLGGMERTEGLAAESGELVAKDWKFKARSAVRGIMGKGRDSWEGTHGWERLKNTLDGLKGKE